MFDIFKIISVALGFLGQRKQAEAKKKQAEEARAKAALDAEKARKKAREEAARRRVQYANSGVLFDGTPDAIIDERQREFDTAIANNLADGEAVADGLESEADDINRDIAVNAGAGLISVVDKDLARNVKNTADQLYSIF